MTNREKILKGAEKLVQKGKIDPAIREYEKLLKLNPNDVNTINRIGDLYIRVGQVDRAVELYERIASSFAADGFVNKAIAIFKKINRLAPDRVEVFEQLADLYIQQGLVVEAKDQFNVLADWYLKNDDLDNAIQIQRKLVQIDPENHMGHLRLADFLFRKGSGDEAIEVYQRLGTMLLDRGKVDEAERLYRHAIDQDPPTGDFLLPVCEALVDSGNLTVAREFLIEAQKRSPENTAIAVLDLRVALAAGESKVAAERAQALLQSHSGDAEVAYLAGRAYLGVGDAEQGRELLLPIANSKLDGGNRAGAEEIFKWLAKALPSDRDVLKLGIRALSPTEDKEMVFTLKAALADSYFQQGESDDARRVYADLINEDPSNKLFRDRMRDLGVDVAGAEQTQGQAQAVPPQAPPSPEPVLIDDVPDEDLIEIDADAFESIEIEMPDDTMGSEEIPPRVVEERPHGAPDFDPLERLAEANVFAKYGLIDKALNHLETIIDFFPENQEVREKLVSLALEAGRNDLAAREVAPLVEMYKAQGNSEALEKLESALPGGLLGSAPAIEPIEVDDAGIQEQVEVEIVEAEVDDAGVQEQVEVEFVEDVIEVESLEMEAGLDVSDVVLVDDFAAAEASSEITEDVESIEMEQVDVDSFEPRDLGTVENGIDFENIEPEVQPANDGDGLASEILLTPDVAVVDAAPTPQRSSAAMDLLSDLEQSVLDGGQKESVTAQEPPLEIDFPADSPSIKDILDEPAAVVDGPVTADLQQMDSFLENSLYEDATRLMRRMESEYPDSPEVAERRLTLKAKGFLLEEAPQVGEESADLFVDEEEAYVDLAAELEEEMAAEEAIVENAAGPSEDEVDLEDVFREFQKGVAEQLSEEDADTHFNLGIAYKEMGLLPEGIREFQIASKDPDFFVECCSMIGVCYADQGMWDQAATWYQRALEAPGLDNRSVLALKYELANCLEGSGDHGGAAEFFDEIMTIDPGFRDVTSRVDGLAGHLQAN